MNWVGGAVVLEMVATSGAYVAGTVGISHERELIQAHGVRYVPVGIREVQKNKGYASKTVKVIQMVQVDHLPESTAMAVKWKPFQHERLTRGVDKRRRKGVV